MDVSEYKTFTADAESDLDSEVNAAIKQGFQPFGNPQFCFHKSGYRFLQAMVRYNVTAQPTKSRKMSQLLPH
jgi:hypothetical protein